MPGIYNITAAGVAKGQENLQSEANAFGSYARYWDGFDITAEATPQRTDTRRNQQRQACRGHLRRALAGSGDDRWGH